MAARFLLLRHMGRLNPSYSRLTRALTRPALEKTTSGTWDLWGGCVPTDAATVKQLFRRVKETCVKR